MNAHLSEILSRRSMAVVTPNAAQQVSTAGRPGEPSQEGLRQGEFAVSAPLARTGDPQTSHDAAARAAHSVAKHEAWIYDAIHQAGARGATAKEIAAATKLTDVQVNRRLAAMGRRNIIERSPLTDCSGFESRNGCAVWWKS